MHHAACARQVENNIQVSMMREQVYHSYDAPSMFHSVHETSRGSRRGHLVSPPEEPNDQDRQTLPPHEACHQQCALHSRCTSRRTNFVGKFLKWYVVLYTQQLLNSRRR